MQVRSAVERSGESVPALEASIGGRTWPFVGVVCALALIVRTGRLNDSLWYDELWSTRLKLGSVWTFVVSSLGDFHPPGYAALMFVWIRLVGDGEWAVRFIPLAAGVAAVWAVYRLGRLAFDETTGRTAAVALCVAPVHVWYSQEARAYALSTLLVLLAGLALVELRRRPGSRGWRVLLVASLAALPLLHYYHVGVVLLLAWTAFDLPRSARKPLLVAAGLSAILVLIYFGVRQQLGLTPNDPFYLRAFTPAESWRLLFAWFLTGNGLQWWVPEGVGGHVVAGSVQAAAAVVLVLGVWRAMRGSNPSTRLVVYLFAIFPAILLALWIAGFGRTYVERSALAALPFFVLLLAAGISALPRSLRPAAIAGLVILQCGGLVSMTRHSDDWTVYKPREAWRDLAQWIPPHVEADAGQALLLATDPATSLAYYGADFGERVDLAAKLRGRRERIARRLGAMEITAEPLLDWVARGAASAEARSAEARVLIVDGPLVASTLGDLQSGRSAATVIVVDVARNAPSFLMRAMASSPRFSEVARQRFPRLEARVYRPRAVSAP